MSKPEQKLTAWLVDFCKQMSNRDFFNDFKVMETKEMSKTVWLFSGSFHISIFMNGESTVKPKILL